MNRHHLARPRRTGFQKLVIGVFFMFSLVAGFCGGYVIDQCRPSADDFFYPCAELDTSNIDYVNDPLVEVIDGAVLFYNEDGEVVDVIDL